MIVRTFNNDPAFKAALQQACMKFMNKTLFSKTSGSEMKSAQLIVRYCDDLLRKGGSKHIQEDGLEETLNQVMIVLQFIEDKDVFENFYMKMFARRLLSGISINDKAEKSMIGKLKHFCGWEYSNKLENMFQDITNFSKDITKSFKQSLNRPLDLDFGIQMLNSRSWPVKQDIDFDFPLPTALGECVRKFGAFYTKQHHCRKLIWLNQLGRGEITTSCFKSSYILNVSTCQMTILLNFNESKTWTLCDLIEVSKIPVATLKEVLQQLIEFNLLDTRL